MKLFTERNLVFSGIFVHLCKNCTNATNVCFLLSPCIIMLMYHTRTSKWDFQSACRSIHVCAYAGCPNTAKHSLLLQYDFFSIKNLRKQYEQMLNKSVRLLIFQFQMPHINRHLMLPCCHAAFCMGNNACTGAFSSESLATFFPFRFTGLPWSGRSHDSWWDSRHRLSLLHLQPPGLVVFDDTQEFTVAPKGQGS